MLIEITHMREEHIDEVADLEYRSFSQPWSREAFCDTLAKDEYIYLVALAEGRVAGYVGAVIALDEGDITNIAVDEQYKRAGIGMELMKQMEQLLAKKAVKEIFLEVRESNLAARSLYAKCGYAEVGIRKNFYQKPVENGIVMKYSID